MTVSAQKVYEKNNESMYMCAFTFHIKAKVIKRHEIVGIHIRIPVKLARWFHRLFPNELRGKFNL